MRVPTGAVAPARGIGRGEGGSEGDCLESFNY